MPLPDNLTTITVNATYALPAAGPQAAVLGQVVFEPNVTTLTDATAPAFLTGQITGEIDATGHLSVTVPCNDNTNLSPTGWIWKVTENLIGQPARAPFYISLPHTLGASVDLADVVTVNPAPPYSTVYGILTAPNTWTAPNDFTDGLAIGGTTIATPPGGTTEFLGADGVWRVPPSAAVSSVNSHTGAVVLTAADVAAIPEAVVTAKGDLLVASGSGTVVRLPIGANGNVLTADSTQTDGLHWTPAAGGGGQTPTIRQSYITSGSITFASDAAWTLYTGATIAIPAAVGDWVELSVGGMWEPAGAGFIDWAVVVAAAAVRYSSTGTGTPAVEGDPGWYPASGFDKSPGIFGFTVTSGDLDAGAVHFAPAHKGDAGGILYCSSAYPLRMRAQNLHTVN